MKPEDAEEYTQSLGQIVSGSWRQIALADRIGVPKALGFKNTRDWVEQRLGGYIKLSIPDRREAAKELAGNGMSLKAIGDVLGASEATISRDFSDLANARNEEAIQPNQHDDLANASREEAIRAEQARQQRLSLFKAIKDSITGLALIAFEDAIADLVKEHAAEFSRANPLGPEYLAERATHVQAGAASLLKFLEEIDWRELQ